MFDPAGVLGAGWPMAPMEGGVLAAGAGIGLEVAGQGEEEGLAIPPTGMEVRVICRVLVFPSRQIFGFSGYVRLQLLVCTWLLLYVQYFTIWPRFDKIVDGTH